jgi:hypothetical protein
LLYQQSIQTVILTELNNRILNLCDTRGLVPLVSVFTEYLK